MNVKGAQSDVNAKLCASFAAFAHKFGRQLRSAVFPDKIHKIFRGAYCGNEPIAGLGSQNRAEIRRLGSNKFAAVLCGTAIKN
ncbi:MAG: hypothetical protein RSB39_05850 [Oscillospiraceae bacterium]